MIKKLLTTFSLVLILTSPVYGATQQVITSGSSDNLNTANITEHIPWFSRGITWGIDEQDSSYVIPTSGTFDDLRVHVTNAPDNGVGTQTWTFIFRIDVASDGYGTFADTSLTCVVSEAQTSCTNSDGFSVVQGDLVSWQVTSAETPSAADAKWSLTWNPTVADESIMLFTSGGGTRAANSNFPMHGQKNHDAQGIDDVGTIIPTPGTFKTLVGWIRTDPGTGTDAWTFAFGTVDCTIEDDEAAYPATCESAADTQAVTAGQTYVLTATETGTVATTTLKAGIVFDPTEEGEWIIVSSNDNPTNTSTTEYGFVGAADFGWVTNQTAQEQLSQAGTFATAMTIEDIYVQFDADVGNASGDIYRFSLRINQADAGTDLACEVDFDVSTTTCNASATNSIANDDLLTFEIDPAGTPSAISGTLVAFTGFIPPTSEAAYTDLMQVH